MEVAISERTICRPVKEERLTRPCHIRLTSAHSSDRCAVNLLEAARAVKIPPNISHVDLFAYYVYTCNFAVRLPRGTQVAGSEATRGGEKVCIYEHQQISSRRAHAPCIAEFETRGENAASNLHRHLRFPANAHFCLTWPSDTSPPLTPEPRSPQSAVSGAMRAGIAQCR